MKQAYLYLCNGRIVASLNPKPEKHKFSKSIRKGSAGKQYHAILKEFESKLMDVENVELQLGIWGIPLESKYIADWTPITPGQKAKIEITGDKKCKVIKIIT